MKRSKPFPVFPRSPSRFALVRYTTDEALDPSFGGDGVITTNFRRGGEEGGFGLVIQSNGKIVAAGAVRKKFALARYTADGTLDPSFGRNGRVTTNFTPRVDAALDVRLDPDGKIVAASYASGGLFREGGRLRSPDTGAPEAWMLHSVTTERR